ncbi:UNVERIFIED_CONTAM: hypothetical protein H355_006128 [Colinus virginianus]|nr:hypothetical protein H355_006128 [Colinus virginianus]
MKLAPAECVSGLHGAAGSISSQTKSGTVVLSWGVFKYIKMSSVTENGDVTAGKPNEEKTYKKTTSSAIKGAIQLGIGYTVGNLTSKPDRDVLMQDFYVVESVFLPR